MAKMNYGPRFGSSAVSVGVHYDPYLDKVNPMFLNRTKIQHQMATAKGNARHAKVSLAGPKEEVKKEINPRLQAELAFKERIEKAVSILSFGLEEFSMTMSDKSASEGIIVSQFAVVNAIAALCKTIKPHLPIPGVGAVRKPLESRKCSNCGEATTGMYCQRCQMD